jgi:hypothetical protein
MGLPYVGGGSHAMALKALSAAALGKGGVEVYLPI